MFVTNVPQQSALVSHDIQFVDTLGTNTAAGNTNAVLATLGSVWQLGCKYFFSNDDIPFRERWVNPLPAEAAEPKSGNQNLIAIRNLRAIRNLISIRSRCPMVERWLTCRSCQSPGAQPNVPLTTGTTLHCIASMVCMVWDLESVHLV